MPERLAESLDISQREDVPKLRKHAIGLWGVLFLTVTGAAPISAMLFNTPISVGFGNGVGTPSGFDKVLATVGADRVGSVVAQNVVCVWGAGQDVVTVVALDEVGDRRAGSERHGRAENSQSDDGGCAP